MVTMHAATEARLERRMNKIQKEARIAKIKRGLMYIEKGVKPCPELKQNIDKLKRLIREKRPQ